MLRLGEYGRKVLPKMESGHGVFTAPAEGTYKDAHGFYKNQKTIQPYTQFCSDGKQ